MEGGSLDRSQYFVAGDSFDVDALLSDWRWLVGPGAYTVHRATAMGNLLLRAPDGSIRLLDTTDGEFRRIASSPEKCEALWEDRHNRRYLLQSYLVRELRQMGLVLAPGQCYSWKTPPLLGGEPDPENVEPADLLVHVSLLGQLHSQARNLKPGTRIDDIQIDAPEPPPA